MKRTFYVSNICIHAETRLRFPALDIINYWLNEINPRKNRTVDELLEAYARTYILMNSYITFDFEEVPNDKLLVYRPNDEWCADLTEYEGLPEQEYEIKLSYPKAIFMQYDGDMTEYSYLPEEERDKQIVYDYIIFYLPLKVVVLREQ